MPDAFIALVTPLAMPSAPGAPPMPGHALPGAWPGHPSQGPVYGGGYPSTQPLPPEGQPGSPSHPIAPVPSPEPGGPPAVYVVYEGKVYGPIYLPVAAPKG